MQNVVLRLTNKVSKTSREASMDPGLEGPTVSGTTKAAPQETRAASHGPGSRLLVSVSGTANDTANNNSHRSDNQDTIGRNGIAQDTRRGSTTRNHIMSKHPSNSTHSGKPVFDLEVSRALYNRESHRNSVDWDVPQHPRASIAKQPLNTPARRIVSFIVPSNNHRESAESGFSIMSNVTAHDVVKSLNKKFPKKIQSNSLIKLLPRMSGTSVSSASSYESDSDTFKTFKSHLKLEETARLEGQLCRVNESHLMPEDFHQTRINYKEMLAKVKGSATNQGNQLSAQSSVLKSSVDVSMGTSGSFYNVDVWPYPWIYPGLRASKDYHKNRDDHHTFTGQAMLPRAEIPLLALTLKGYLDSVKPCVTREMFAHTKQLTEQFAMCCGKKYNSELIRRMEGEQDWHHKALPNYTYTFSRQELPLQNVTFVAPMMNDFWPAKDGSQINRAALFTSLTLEFFLLVHSERLVRLKTADGKEKCMHAFRKLFSSCRVPGIPEDGVAAFFHTQRLDMNNISPKHIVIMYRGSIYDIDVFDDNWKPIGLEELKQKIEFIVKVGNEIEVPQAIGVLTSAPRHVWCKARQLLMKVDEDNIAFLQKIEQAIFVLSLDHANAKTTKIYQEAIFADGCNRWYDHGLNVYIHANGLITCNVNRAIHDGWAVAIMLDYIHLRILEDTDHWDDAINKASSKSTVGSNALGTPKRLSELEAQESDISNMNLQDDISVIHPSTMSVGTVLNECYRLDFTTNDEIDQYVQDSISNFNTLSGALTCAQCEYMDFETNVFKKHHIHLDALAHLIMHLTFYRMYFTLPSIGTRVFISTVRHGRYELMRSTTAEAFAWCKLMLETDATEKDKIKAYHAAEEKHRHIQMLSVDGRGVSNHLTTLKLVAEDMDGATPELFRDESYFQSGGDEMFKIVAESFGRKCLAQPVVVPTHKRGYGVGYTIVQSRVTYSVTSWKDEPSSSADLLAASLRRTMETYHDFFHSI